MFQKITLKIKKSIWLYPTIYGIISLLLAVAIGYLDTSETINLSDYLPRVFMTSIDLSKTILGTIASSLFV